MVMDVKRLQIPDLDDKQCHALSSWTNGGVIVGRLKHYEFLTCMQLQHACASCKLEVDDFVDPIYKLEDIYKVYQHYFYSLDAKKIGLNV